MGNSRSSSTSLHHTKEHLEPQILHSYQIIMRTVWRHMAQGGHASSGATVLKRLIIKEPKVKNVFHHTAVITRMGKSSKNDSQSQTRTCSLNDHQSEIVRFMQYVMNNLDSPSQISIECTRIGRIHRRIRQFGLKPEYWDLLGESLTETIREYQGWRRHRESLRAANLLVSFLVDRIRAGFIERDSLVSLIPPRPILKSSPSRTEDLNGNISRKSSMRHKESVRFNKNRKSDEGMEDEDGINYGRARAGMRRMTESSHRMIRSRSEMGRIEWIDNDDDDQFDLPVNQYSRRKEKEDRDGRDYDDDDEEYNHLRRRIRSSSERRHRSHNNRDIIYRNQLPEYSTPSRIIPPPLRLLPRTPTIDFSSYRSPPQCYLNHSSTCPSLHKRSLTRYHSLDHGYNSASSPSDGEHYLHRPNPSLSPSKPPTLPLNGIIRHSSSSSHHNSHNVFDPSSHQSTNQSYSSRPNSIDNR